MTALPKGYYYFFWLVEPTLTILGAAYAIFLPEQYASELLPAHTESSSIRMGMSTRGQMVIGGLGSCFFLLAMISLALFPKFQSLPEGSQKEGFVKALLVPLAIADIIHIVVTLLPLPISLLQSPTKWTGLIHGNISITTVLFAVRTAWFLGLGRMNKSAKPGPAAPVKVGGSEAAKPRRTPRKSKAAGQVEVPLPSPPAVVATPKKLAEVEAVRARASYRRKKASTVE